MTATIELPVWLFLLILLFAVVTFASHFLFPSVRWFFRRRLERAVARLNTRLERPIQPFKLARRHDMIQRLIYDPEVGLAVQQHAQDEGVPEAVAFEKAGRYAREIVPAFSAFTYFALAIRMARFFGNSFYRVRLGHVDEKALSAIDRDATVVFVMNHRSNMDYVLVTYLAAERTTLSYAVGEWAQVWPLSRLIRAMGAYFIRRRSRNDLYRKVLASYVRHATAGGVTQAMFPEGGLSLDGRLGRPKLGLLKYIVESGADAGRDVVFVPVALNYDRVLEDRILTAAAGSEERRFDARIGVITGWFFRQIGRRLTGRYHRFGYAAVSFGGPVSLREFRRSQTGDLTVALARELMSRIGDIVPVLPVPLVAWLIRANGAMTRGEIETAFSRATVSLSSSHMHLPRNNRDYAVEVGLRMLTERNILTERDGKFDIGAESGHLLDYYANSIAHLMPGGAPAGAAAAKEISAPAGS